MSNTDKPTDREIIEAILSGGIKRQRYENLLYSRYLPLAHKLQFKYRLEDEEAADAYTEAFLVVISHLISGKFEGKSSLKTYLYRIIRNKCVDIIRKKTTIQLDIIDEFPALADESKDFLRTLISKEDWKTVEANIQQLGKRCQELLKMVSQGYSPAEIAPMMGFKTARSVSSQRYKCLEQLKAIIFKDS